MELAYRPMRCLMRDGIAVTRAAFRPLGFRGGSGAGAVVNRALTPCGEGQSGQEARIWPFLIPLLTERR